MTSTVIYQGDLRTIATHAASGSTFETDAPLDNQGKGERFSPTDTVATALATCMATIMGIAARTHHIKIEGTRFEVTKAMKADPRRIGAINIEITFPLEYSFEIKEKKILETAAFTCPVWYSLHPDMEKNIIFHWPAAE